MESWVQSWRPRTNAFCKFFDSTCLNYCACHEKVIPGHTKCCTCHAKSSQQTWRSDAPKCNPSGNQRPDLLTALMNMSLVISGACHGKFILADPLQMSTPVIVFGNATKPSCLVHFLKRCTIPCACHAKRHLNVKKWSEHVVILTCWPAKCASRHNRVHFSTSQLPNVVRKLVCFVHFDFEMCCAPQRRANVRHLNFQKWSENGVFCTFWLRNVLRATTACNCSTSQLPKWSENGVFCTFWLRNVLRATTACTFSQLNFQKCSEPALFSTLWLRNALRATTACNFSSLISQTAPHPLL